MRHGSHPSGRQPHAPAAARVLVVALTSLLGVTAFVIPAAAVWNFQGNLISSVPGDQHTPASVADGTGGVYITWSEFRAATSSFDIRVAHVYGTGVVDWVVSACEAAGDQTDPVIDTDGAGGAVIAWVDMRNGNKDVYANRVGLSGGFHSGWHEADGNGKRITFSPSDELNPAIVHDGANGAYIAWNLAFSASDLDVYLQHVLSSGSLASGFAAGGLGVATPTGHQQRISLATDAGGYALLAWEDERPTNPRHIIYAQRVSPTAVIQWAAQGMAVSNGVNDDDWPAIAPAPLGGSVIVWSQVKLPSDGRYDLYAQRFNTAGAAQWSASNVRVTDYPGSDGSARVSADLTRGLWITWHNLQANDDEFLAVTLLQWDGTIAPGFGSGHQLVYGNILIQRFALANAGSAGAVVSWADHRSGLFHRYLQQVSLGGLDAFQNSGWPLVEQPDGQYEGTVVSDGGIGAIAVWEDGRGSTDAIYAYRVAGPGNLIASYVPSGWSSPIVPRDAGDANLGSTVVSSTLPGNAAGTWLNWNLQQTDDKLMVMDTGELTLDEEIPLNQLTWTNPEFGPFFVFVNNLGPYSIRGGRHSLRARADFNDAVFERDENDNDWIGQWVWSPATLSYQVPVHHVKPPDAGPLFLPNSIGFSFTRNVSYAWAIGLMVDGEDDDYDLHVYSDYSGSTSGFSAFVTGSTQAGTNIDFAVGHYSGTPVTLYPAAIRYDATNGERFWIDPTDARSRNVDDTNEDDHTFLETFGPGRSVNVYEFMLFSGQTYYFGLLGPTFGGKLRFELFPASPGSSWGHGEGTFSNEVMPEFDNLTFVAPTTGWYPVVVYRAYGNAGQPVDYRFQWSSTAPIVNVEPAPGAASFSLGLDPITPNPARGEVGMSFTLPATGPARLALFDAAGRRVRTLVDGERPLGRTALRWDGRDESGSPVGAGLYWARLEAAGRVVTRKLVRIP
jgi:hypothetical protein